MRQDIPWVGIHLWVLVCLLNSSSHQEWADKCVSFTADRPADECIGFTVDSPARECIGFAADGTECVSASANGPDYQIDFLADAALVEFGNTDTTNDSYEDPRVKVTSPQWSQLGVP